jgi:hypothetical protein
MRHHPHHRLRRRSAEIAGRNSRAALGVVALLLAQSALAQSKDVPPPPRLDPAPLVFTITPKEIANKPPDPAKLSAAQLASTAAPVRPPNAAMLAPPTQGRGDTAAIDEIVVIGTSSHLPDLGGRWRARQQAAEEDAKGNAHLTVLPLYDPERPTEFDSLLAPPEMQRMGYIDLFRVRFGHRTKPAE